ncbi:hypothetical protein GE09DRAFT_570805 [Coniochaeta sp. 2T2.1]|nr:hypothetical protein GE09DRAFT_570805 [Coniochaeta sp. 2T2.1]
MVLWAAISWTLSVLLDGELFRSPGSNSNGVADSNNMLPELSDWHFKRDVCADVFGAGASNSNCAPSNTLCCTRTNQTFPSCQQYLGKGWCCVGEYVDLIISDNCVNFRGLLTLVCSSPSDDCYVDQPSACDESNAVSCTNTITDGSAQVCCTKLTSCVPGYTVTSANVRCQIKFVDLQKLAVASGSSASSSSSTSKATSAVGAPVSASSSSASTTSPSSTPVTTSAPVSATNTMPQGQQTQTPLPSASTGLPVGAIAGISVGLTLAVVLAAIFLFLYLRSRRKAKAASTTQQQPTAAPSTFVPYKAYDEYNGRQEMYVQEVYQGYGLQEAADGTYRSNMPSEPVEMPATPRR